MYNYLYINILAQFQYRVDTNTDPWYTDFCGIEINMWLHNILIK